MIRQVIIENLLIFRNYFVYSLFNHMTSIFVVFHLSFCIIVKLKSNKRDSEFSKVIRYICF